MIACRLDVPPRRVCPVINITDGLCRALSTLDFHGPHGAIVPAAIEFTAQDWAAKRMERLGAEVVVVPPTRATIGSTPRRS